MALDCQWYGWLIEVLRYFHSYMESDVRQWYNSLHEETKRDYEDENIRNRYEEICSLPAQKFAVFIEYFRIHVLDHLVLGDKTFLVDPENDNEEDDDKVSKTFICGRLLYANYTSYGFIILADSVERIQNILFQSPKPTRTLMELLEQVSHEFLDEYIRAHPILILPKVNL